jgi:hypothetical protein
MTRINLFLILIFVCLLTITFAVKEVSLGPGIQVVDTFMGVGAEYEPGPVNCEIGYQYSCKQLVNNFYKKYFGGCFFINETVEECLPIPGAVAKFEVPYHWAIVKEVKGDKVVLFEQNWKYPEGIGDTTTLNREVAINACLFYKLKGKDYRIFEAKEETYYTFTITSEPEFIYGETIVKGKEGENRDITAKQVEGYTFQYWKGVLKETNGKLIIDNGLYKKKNRDGWREFCAEKVESK